MIRLKHILAEIGEASAIPYPYNMYNGEAYFETQGGNMYRVTFPYGSDEVMEIAFATQNAQGGWDYDVETAEGDIYRVMSTITNIAREAVDRIQPKAVVFGVSKSDPRRMRLYRAYVQRALTGYHVTAETASYMEFERAGFGGAEFDWTGIKNKG